MTVSHLISFGLKLGLDVGIFVGIVFNMFGICYLLRLPKKVPFHRILLALVIIDILFVMTVIIYQPYYGESYNDYVFALIFPYTMALTFSLIWSSFHLTVSLAWELSLIHI